MRQHGLEMLTFFYLYSSTKSILSLQLISITCYLSIHIAENDVMMIMTIVLLCFKVFFAA